MARKQIPGGKHTTSRTGDWAESRAAELLSAKGLTLLERNFRRQCGELDLVFRDGRTIVFVEVRYRADDRWGDGLASITAAKRRRLSRAASSWLKRYPTYRRSPCRFDAVAVTGSESAPGLKWVRGAFEAA